MLRPSSHPTPRLCRFPCVLVLGDIRASKTLTGALQPFPIISVHDVDQAIEVMSQRRPYVVVVGGLRQHKLACDLQAVAKAIGAAIVLVHDLTAEAVADQVGQALAVVQEAERRSFRYE